MHDCRATKARLVDLIFGEAADAERLLAEVRSCAGCAAEHRALSETLRSFDLAADDARPAEGFWPQYHARLAQRVHAAGPATPAALDDAASGDHSGAPSSPPLAWLRRALAARWSVPAPAALAALLLIACLTPLALRPSPAAVAPPPQKNDPAPAPDGSQPVRTIEVPVVREKIVTRTVYVTRPARKRERAPLGADARVAPGSSPADARPAPRRDTLTGFQPAGDVKLRVIKGSFPNER